MSLIRISINLISLLEVTKTSFYTFFRQLVELILFLYCIDAPFRKMNSTMIIGFIPHVHVNHPVSADNIIKAKI